MKKLPDKQMQYKHENETLDRASAEVFSKVPEIMLGVYERYPWISELLQELDEEYLWDALNILNNNLGINHIFEGAINYGSIPGISAARCELLNLMYKYQSKFLTKNEIDALSYTFCGEYYEKNKDVLSEFDWEKYETSMGLGEITDWVGPNLY
jgi:hypothetical protein